MTDSMFTAGQRVYHRQLQRYGTYVTADDLDRDTSHVDFDDPHGEDVLRITTAQLVAADDAEAGR